MVAEFRFACLLWFNKFQQASGLIWISSAGTAVGRASSDARSRAAAAAASADTTATKSGEYTPQPAAKGHTAPSSFFLRVNKELLDQTDGPNSTREREEEKEKEKDKADLVSAGNFSFLPVLWQPGKVNSSRALFLMTGIGIAKRNYHTHRQEKCFIRLMHVWAKLNLTYNRTSEWQ